MQQLSSLQSICDVVAETLNTMFEAKFSTKTHSRHLIHRILKKATGIKSLRPYHLDPYSGPALLQQDRPLAIIQEGTTDTPLTSLKRIREVTANERGQNVFHEHHQTCRKGFNSRIRCCPAKKSGTCKGTHCVYLEHLEEEEKDEANWSVKIVNDLTHQAMPGH